jgi:hypothetical protein
MNAYAFNLIELRRQTLPGQMGIADINLRSEQPLEPKTSRGCTFNFNPYLSHV